NLWLAGRYLFNLQGVPDDFLASPIFARWVKLFGALNGFKHLAALEAYLSGPEIARLSGEYRSAFTKLFLSGAESSTVEALRMTYRDQLFDRVEAEMARLSSPAP
ncbi:hypothetical protein K2X33_02660, partial [bacterium]|nr:hypothetical protein [bacterium]